MRKASSRFATIPLACLALAACASESTTAPDVDAAVALSVQPTTTPCAHQISADWARGATTLLNAQAHQQQVNTVCVIQDRLGTPGVISFRRWDQTGASDTFGRTNGAGDNGTATHAFAYRANWNGQSWTAAVPFAFGTRSGNREALWTPTFQVIGIPGVHMGVFVTDNGTGDESPIVGIIQVGDFRAIDGDVHEGRPGKVIFRRRVGTSWDQVSRTNGEGDDGQLLSFAVVTVRSSFTVGASGTVTAQSTSQVPVAKTCHIRDKRLELRTPLLATNIGTAQMYRFATTCTP
jgi:hypothetical protein